VNPLDSIVVILYRPENPTNIGAIVRAMKNMGVTRLRLVQPAPYTVDDLLRLAHRCDDIVAGIALFAELDAALADLSCVVGTAAIAHAGHRITQDVRGLAAELVARTAAGSVGLLFGAEADGLDRHALARCHLLAALPTNPAYPALNLAQSVLLFLYELRMAAVAPPVPAVAPPVAPQAHLERLFAASEEALHAIDFFRYNPAAVMHTLRQLAYRAALQPDEAALLLAIARRTVRAAAYPRSPSSDESQVD
jgi:TrmH family RNA methyltransferase